MHVHLGVGGSRRTYVNTMTSSLVRSIKTDTDLFHCLALCYRPEDVFVLPDDSVSASLTWHHAPVCVTLVLTTSVAPIGYQTKHRLFGARQQDPEVWRARVSSPAGRPCNFVNDAQELGRCGVPPVSFASYVAGSFVWWAPASPGSGQRSWLFSRRSSIPSSGSCLGGPLLRQVQARDSGAVHLSS